MYFQTAKKMEGDGQKSTTIYLQFTQFQYQLLLLIYFGRFSPPPVRSKNARYQIVDAIKPNPNHLERSTIKSSTATTLSNNKKPILETEPEPEYEYYYEYIYEEGL